GARTAYRYGAARLQLPRRRPPRMNVPFDRLVDAVVRAAEPWRDPDYEPRARAVEETLQAENSFTTEAIAFAVNQQMSLLTEEHLRMWISGRFTQAPLQVGVLNAGNVPLVGLQDFLAVLLTGHR